MYGRLGSIQHTKVEPEAQALVAQLQHSLIPLKVPKMAAAAGGG